ncbi:MAG TPA: hypothetical protein VNZ46_27515 [Pedobacter sp.]|nr:hypothetical protein [Pedobacter sp.]
MIRVNDFITGASGTSAAASSLTTKMQSFSEIQGLNKQNLGVMNTFFKSGGKRLRPSKAEKDKFVRQGYLKYTKSIQKFF